MDYLSGRYEDECYVMIVSNHADDTTEKDNNLY